MPYTLPDPSTATESGSGTTLRSKLTTLINPIRTAITDLDIRVSAFISGGSGIAKDEIDARDHGVGPLTADNTGPLNQALGELDRAGGLNDVQGKRIYLPSGILPCAGQVNGALGAAAATMYGEGGVTHWDGVAATCIRYTGGGTTSFFRNGSSNGFTMRDLQVQYTNPAFTGYLIDQSRWSEGGNGDTAMTTYQGCTLGGGQTAYSAKAIIHGNSSHSIKIADCALFGAYKGFEGLPPVPGDYCNMVTIENTLFLMTRVAISNVHQALKVEGCCVEGLSNALWNGSSTIYAPLNFLYKDDRVAIGSQAHGFSFIGNWCGDSFGHAADTVWIHAGNASFSGLNVQGNFFGTGGKVIDFGGALCDGAALMGNVYTGDNAGTTSAYQNFAGAGKVYARGNGGIPDIG